MQAKAEAAKAVFEAALASDKAKGDPKLFGFLSMQYARFLTTVSAAPSVGIR